MKRIRASCAWAAWAWCIGHGFERLQARAEPAVRSVPTGDFLGDDGQWTVFTFNVGTPSQQVNLLASSSSSQLLLQAANGCPATIPDCSGDRGGLYNSTSSSSWQGTGAGNVSLEANLGISVDAIYGTETVEIGPIRLDSQTVSQINDIRYWIGSVGLHPWDVDSNANNTNKQDLITALKEQGDIPSLSFGYTAGAQYQLKGVPGSLTLGGYDAARFDADKLLQVKFADNDTRDLMVQVTGISTGINGTQMDLLPNPLAAYIDTTVTDIWLPLAACLQFEDAFGIQWNSTNELYYLNGTQQAALSQASPNVTFTLADPAGGPSQEIVISYGAFALSAEWPRYSDYPNTTSYFPLRRAANLSQVTIGRAFFQETYLFVNFENKTFNLSPTIFSTSAPPNLISFYPNGSTSQSGANSGGPGSSSSPSSSSSSSSSSSTIGGAVGGAIGGAILLGIACYFFWRRRSKSDKTSLDEKASALESSNGDVGTGTHAQPRPLTATQRGELPTGTENEIYQAATRQHGSPWDPPEMVDVSGMPMSELHGEGTPVLSPAERLRRRAELGTSYSGAELQGSGKQADAELMGTPVVSAVEVSSVPSPTQASFSRGPGGEIARSAGVTSPTGGEGTVSLLNSGAASPHSVGSPHMEAVSPPAGSPRMGAVSPDVASSPRLGAVSPVSAASPYAPSPLTGSPAGVNAGRERPGLQRNPSTMDGI